MDRLLRPLMLALPLAAVALVGCGSSSPKPVVIPNAKVITPDNMMVPPADISPESAAAAAAEHGAAGATPGVKSSAPPAGTK